MHICLASSNAWDSKNCGNKFGNLSFYLVLFSPFRGRKEGGSCIIWKMKLFIEIYYLQIMKLYLSKKKIICRLWNFESTGFWECTYNSFNERGRDKCSSCAQVQGCWHSRVSYRVLSVSIWCLSALGLLLFMLFLDRMT